MMINVSQSFTYPAVKNASGQPLVQRQQNADAFAEHFTNVRNGDFRKLYNEPFAFAELKSVLVQIEYIMHYSNIIQTFSDSTLYIICFGFERIPW